MVIAYHVILTGYGHWLPNDPRGSMSDGVRSGRVSVLGTPHPGRKLVQPSRAELKSFYRDAKTRLEHRTTWFDPPLRILIAEAFATAIGSRGYTCFACSVLSNHAHLVIRKHRDKVETMITHLKTESAAALRSASTVPPDHPVWSSDMFKRFLFTGDGVRRVVRYVCENPIKEGIGPQRYEFVKDYKGEWDRS